METLFGGVAFALLMAAPVLAVIAVRAMHDEDAAGNPGPNPSSVDSPAPDLAQVPGTVARTDGRLADQAKQAFRNAKSTRATFMRAGAAWLLSRAEADTAPLVARQPEAAPGL